jgi:hypothetical protein
MQTPEHKQRSLFMLMLVQLSTGFSMGARALVCSEPGAEHGPDKLDWYSFYARAQLISTPTMGYLYQNLGANSSVWLVTLALFLNAGYSYLVIREKTTE